jgi:hypothetical protein
VSTIVPKDRVSKITWYENHAPTWVTAATSIGTTSAKATLVSTRTTAARAAYNAQQLAIERARVATNAFYDAVALMGSAGSDVIKDVKAKGDRWKFHL